MRGCATIFLAGDGRGGSPGAAHSHGAAARRNSNRGIAAAASAADENSPKIKSSHLGHDTAGCTESARLSPSRDVPATTGRHALAARSNDAEKCPTVPAGTATCPPSAVYRGEPLDCAVPLEAQRSGAKNSNAEPVVSLESVDVPRPSTPLIKASLSGALRTGAIVVRGQEPKKECNTRGMERVNPRNYRRDDC